jgi:predicted  nucleic acid-binding Zn-ribbon protein
MNQSVEKKLKALYKIQNIDSNLDKLSAVKGDLPLEVADLEDEIEGLNTRLVKINDNIAELNTEIDNNINFIKDKEKTILRYKEQLNDVRNNREFEALSKEIEIMELEIMSMEKSNKEAKELISQKEEGLSGTKSQMEVRQKDLDFKKDELKVIITETEQEEDKLREERAAAFEKIDERFQIAYTRVRGSVRNGIAVAPILRGSCGGCFASIPPQRQSDIRQHMKIIDCENCGRIIVDSAISGLENIIPEKTKKRRVSRKKAATEEA